MPDTKRCIFFGMQILIAQKWESHQAVIVEDEKIKAILPVEMMKHHMPAKMYEFPADYHLLPGLMDLHIHGIHGKDVMDASEEALQEMSHALAAQGVTGFLATTMTARAAQLEAVLKICPAAMLHREGAAILGVHLEGPFIAASKIGAQCREGLCEPNVSLMRRWQKLAQGAIKIVTLAPELPGALSLIQALHDMNVIASVGHTDATYDQTCAAITAGCTQATHLFNAMRGLHQREPGALGALLLSDRVTAELIVDGVHLHPAMVELALRVKGKDKLLLVTDAMRATCLGNGHYDLGGQQVEVQAGKATLGDGTLAGSTLRMPEALLNMVHFSQCSFAEAIGMASMNPARVLKLETRKGSINVGKDADLVVMNPAAQVVLTMREGREIFRY
jgi:N-acetylglucosamine-6-phosphate deacetylase